MSMGLLEQYAEIVGEDVIDQLRQLGSHLAGMKVVHVNSTKEGGGVAEILNRLIPLKRELQLDVRWEVISGTDPFFRCTKLMHNALQGNSVEISHELLREYERVNEENAESLRHTLEDADIVFIHDPQPAPLFRYTPNRRGRWIWRCHIDAGHPFRPVWKYLRPYVEQYHASIWSISEFAQYMQHPLYLVAPSIDPLSEKNVDLSEQEITATYHRWGLDPERPIITQISRFDRFKDPIGVIHTYRLIRDFTPVQLVLAGGGATDDPESEEVIRQVRESAGKDEDIHVFVLPSDDHRTINALQRISDIVIQKSTREGSRSSTITPGSL
jgi:trehalose synthase